MNFDLIFAGIAIIAIVWVAWKAPGPALLLAVALIGLTSTGVIDFELNRTQQIADDAREAVHEGSKTIERETAPTK